MLLWSGCILAVACILLLISNVSATEVHARCPELGNTSLWYFMHIPKAGGSAFGEFLTRHFDKQFIGGSCDLKSCHAVKVNSLFDPLYTDQCGEHTVEWLQGGAAPEGYPPFVKCGFFWGQHTDVTTISAIATPPWSPLRDAAVSAVTYIRRPVDLILSEFFYAKYLEPKQPHMIERIKAFGNKLEGVSLTDYLEEKIFSRCENGKVVGPLIAFFTGLSGWASCPHSPTVGCIRNIDHGKELLNAATWNAARFAFVGVTEMQNESQAVLEAALRIPKGAGVLPDLNHNRVDHDEGDEVTEDIRRRLYMALEWDEHVYNVLVRRLELRYQRLVRREAADLTQDQEEGSAPADLGSLIGGRADAAVEASPVGGAQAQSRWAPVPDAAGAGPPQALEAEEDIPLEYIVEAALTLSPEWHSGAADVRGSWLPKLGRRASYFEGYDMEGRAAPLPHNHFLNISREERTALMQAHHRHMRGGALRHRRQHHLGGHGGAAGASGGAGGGVATLHGATGAAAAAAGHQPRDASASGASAAGGGVVAAGGGNKKRTTWRSRRPGGFFGIRRQPRLL